MTEPFNVLVTADHWTPEAQDMVRTAGGSIHFMHGAVTEATLGQRLAETGAQALVVRGIRPVTDAVLARAPALRIIAKNGAGIDGVDLAAAGRRGMVVAVAAAANADAVAEHALALMLALTRELPRLDRMVREGTWADSRWQGRDFRGSVVGIVGYGSIGRATARLVAAVGATVLVLHSGSRHAACRADGFEGTSALEEFLPRLDILSLHCPLTDSTRGLVGARTLAMLKPGSLLINTARGPLVQEAALFDALRSGHLAGAGLDTFDTEPLPAGHALRQMQQVLLTPHVAGVTRNSARNVALLTARNVVSHLEGRPLPAGHQVLR
ncbi:MAG: NAD(P)-dependent oxidoreductase [Pseudomonadota bacterium]